MNDIFDEIILVTGANGQLGKELQEAAFRFPGNKFLFATKESLPIHRFDLVKRYFEQQQIDVCINCAAYTAVDKAESEKANAFLINGEAAGNIAAVCKAHKAKLIHISTDYVFNGTATSPYTEKDGIDPVNVYGASKLKGEELVFINDPSAIVIRTSWVYSSFGKNFVKTMFRLLKEKDEISVVNDQYGSPTYAADLADAILHITGQDTTGVKGIFNYCNSGVTTWYDFAIAIKKFIKSKCTIHPISTAGYPTPAKRPHYSALDTSRIKKTFGITIPKWKDSLHKCLSLLS